MTPNTIITICDVVQKVTTETVALWNTTEGASRGASGSD